MSIYVKNYFIDTMCPLCLLPGKLYYKGPVSHFFECDHCSALYVAPEFLPDPETEITHYQNHNNNIEDVNYQNFASAIISAVLKDFSKDHVGLDFGAGTGSVIIKMLEEKNFNIKPYDPFFSNDKNLLEQQYDFITTCEVIEHFHKPFKEFLMLKNLLKNGGKLYCMTHIYDDSIPFENWYYKNDPTHVFIYRSKTFSVIKDRFGFSEVEIKGRLITLSI